MNTPVITPSVPFGESGINKCPAEVIGLIIDQVANPMLYWSEYWKVNEYWQLKACALVSRLWRYSAQRALHTDVRITPASFQNKMRSYDIDLEAKNTGTSGNIWQFPKRLHVFWETDTPVVDLLRFPEFQAFMQRVGPRLTTLRLNCCTFSSLETMANLLSLCPSVQVLYVEQCSYGITTFLQAKRYRNLRAPSACPSLRDLILDAQPHEHRNYALDTLAFSLWFMREPRDQLKSVDLLGIFRCTPAYDELTRTLLPWLGASLTHATLLWDHADGEEDEDEDEDEEDFANDSVYPDFSTNERLEFLRLDLLIQETNSTSQSSFAVKRKRRLLS
ncbi:hypothetical protein BDY19DRAFT_1061173 [Irpex rosettiformis]|uniref:Uncharacterized protein n=1 Tax=Irpex rosettiformis TaxID=378272 RepID=A0ACB8TLN2_9APHY|nr:hypothetical protein BDY19DRAFT_1061173 [Irpex rosettiformis]